MANALPARYGHVAVCMENCIIVFGGEKQCLKGFSFHTIWMYNIITEQWGSHVIPEGNKAPPPPTNSVCTVMIEKDIHMFGGYLDAQFEATNALWKLVRTPARFFEWSEVICQGTAETPSPRHGHRGWEYTGNMWAFAGLGPHFPGHYLHDHGEFNSVGLTENNQLLCFNPSTNKWTNPKSTGSVPSPRSRHAIAISGDQVWLYGGSTLQPYCFFNDLYQLDMTSLMWTKIQTGGTKPQQLSSCSLSVVSEHQLVLHGGHCCGQMQNAHDHMLHRTGLWTEAQVRGSKATEVALLPRTCTSVNNPVL